MSTPKHIVPFSAEQWQQIVTERLKEDRSNFDEWKETVRKEFEVAHSRTAVLESQLKLSNENSQALLDILVTAKGGLKVLGGLGFVLKWVASIAIPAITLWALITGKPFPKIGD